MILDILTTAARFPHRDGVLKAFNLGAYDDAKYQQMIDQLTALPPSIIPEISNFVFGVDEEVVKKVISDFPGYYLFVDFGNIDSSVDSNNRINDSFNLSFTVAKRVAENSVDQIATAIVFDNCLQMAATIKRTLIKEKKAHPWLTDIDGNSSFSPFVARELGSIGWSLMFNRQGLDLLCIK